MNTIRIVDKDAKLCEYQAPEYSICCCGNHYSEGQVTEVQTEWTQAEAVELLSMKREVLEDLAWNWLKTTLDYSHILRTCLQQQIEGKQKDSKFLKCKYYTI
jgi:hypothetical protein